MGIFKPTVEELREMGVSGSTYLENWFALYKVSGVVLWSKPFTRIFHLTRCLAILTMTGFIIGTGVLGDKENSFESLQYLLQVIMMYAGPVAFYYYQDEFLMVHQLLGGFDYEGTLNEATLQEIVQIKAEANQSKKGFKNIVWGLIIGTIFALLGKKPLGYLIHGRGVKLVDGEHNLMYNSAFGSYMPFADYWGPYVISLIFSYVETFWFIISHNGYMASFQFTSEDLLAEFEIVGRTLGCCVERAKLLHSKK